MLSYTTLSDAELERWIYSSLHDVRALDEALNRLTSGGPKYTQDELDEAVDAAEQAIHDVTPVECPKCGHEL